MTAHAIHRDRTVDVDGHVANREFHYLTCKKCHVERDANELALVIAKLLHPDDWVRHKFKVEGVLREYLESGKIVTGL